MIITKKHLVLLLALLMSLPTFAGGSGEIPTVTVIGTGVITLKPDTASITLAVETVNTEVSVAATENAELMTRVTDALLQAGVAKDDIATRNYYVSQDSSYNQETRKTEYSDYRVSNNLTITVRAIDKTGSVIDAALSAGANRLSNVNFYASDAVDAYEEARKLAIMQAKDAAQTLATAAEKKLGETTTIEEYNNPAAYRNTFSEKAFMSDSAPTPITAGDTEISVRVQVVFELL